MKLHLILIFSCFWIFLIPAHLYSQVYHAELGVSGGVSYYLGDINYTQQFYKPRQSAGIFFRNGMYNHFALRSFIHYGYLTANDQDFDYDYQKVRNRKFSQHFLALGSMLEFNFLPYKPGNVRKEKITPFVAAGLSYTLFIQSITIPFGFGVKYNVTRNWAVGAQHFYNFLLQDNMDISTYQNLAGQQISNPKNRDWYACFQISLSYKIDNYLKCPAYD